MKYFIKVVIVWIFFIHSLYAMDKWKLNIGVMAVTDFSTQVEISPKRYPVGVMLDTAEDLGMKYDTGAFRIDGYYRLNNNHSIDFSYFGVRSGGHKISRGIEFDDYNITAGAAIDSYFNMDVYKINYGYSFYHNEKVELMLTAGLHITVIDLGLSATGTIIDKQTGTVLNSIEDSSGDATVPLPVVGFKGEYTIVENQLFVSYRSEYFRLSFDGYYGDLISSALSFEYRFLQHYGVACGYNANRINVKVDDGEKIIKVRNNLSGFMLTLSYIY